HFSLPSFPTRRSSDLYRISLAFSPILHICTDSGEKLLRKYSASLFSDMAFSTFTSQCQSKNWTSFDFQVCPPQLLHRWLVSRFRSEEHTSELQSRFDL